MVKYPIRTRVLFQGNEGYIMGYRTNPYENEPFHYIVRFHDVTKMEYIRTEDIITVKLPSIEQSEHMGDILVEDTYVCPITFEHFVDGEEVVQLLKNSNFIYKLQHLAEFWKSRPTINPSTNLPITQQSDITRWTVRIV
jgi:hypothetical protein